MIVNPVMAEDIHILEQSITSSGVSVEDRHISRSPDDEPGWTWVRVRESVNGRLSCSCSGRTLMS